MPGVRLWFMRFFANHSRSPERGLFQGELFFHWLTLIGNMLMLLVVLVLWRRFQQVFEPSWIFTSLSVVVVVASVARIASLLLIFARKIEQSWLDHVYREIDRDRPITRDLEHRDG